jgi:hypothetical protein
MLEQVFNSADGTFVVIDVPTIESIEEVPASITPHQIRLHLTAIGLRQSVEDYVASASLDVKDWWEFSLSYERNAQLLLEAATTLGLTSDQLDQFFIKASKL